MPAFCNNRPGSLGQSRWFNQEMPHHGNRQRNQTVTALSLALPTASARAAIGTEQREDDDDHLAW